MRPDLSAWGKAIGNGYPDAALLGTDGFRRAAERIFTTGSFWFSSVSMAAAVATITTVNEERSPETIARVGRLLRDGMAGLSAAHGVRIKQTGPVQSQPLLRRRRALRTGPRLRRRVHTRGVFVHPSHNWFLSSAHTDEDVSRTLEAMDHAFAHVAVELPWADRNFISIHGLGVTGGDVNRCRAGVWSAVVRLGDDVAARDLVRLWCL